MLCIDETQLHYISHVFLGKFMNQLIDATDSIHLNLSSDVLSRCEWRHVLNKLPHLSYLSAPVHPQRKDVKLYSKFHFSPERRSASTIHFRCA